MDGEANKRDRQLDQWLFDLCEQRLSPEDLDRLKERLATDDDTVRRFVEVMYFNTDLSEWARRDGNAIVLESMLQDLTENPEIGSFVPVSAGSAEQITHDPLNSASAWTRRRVAYAAIAAALIGVALFPMKAIFWNEVPPNQQAPEGTIAALPQEQLPVAPEVAQPDDPTPVAPPAEATPRAVFVAHIVEATSDATWAENSAPFDPTLRIGIGEQISLTSGVLRLEYYSGAQVILHGPAVFVPTGRASGHLASGRMTGKVSDSEVKEFHLSTPSAQVIDLGTVFGVAVNDPDNTDVCVFDGKVEVSSLGEAAAANQPIQLGEGMSVRLSRDGQADLTAQIDRSQFLEELPTNENIFLAANEISLIDAFIDGPGLSHRLLATLDPMTGKPDADPSRYLRHGADTGYRLAVYSEFVDGAFVPPNTSQAIQIDSYGNRVHLPPTLGYTFGTIWARRPVPGLELSSALNDENRDEFWEIGATREAFAMVNASRLGAIGLHSNVGLTFDLTAIHSVEGQASNQFHCSLVNLGGAVGDKFMREQGKPNRADVRIYVDGVERHVEKGLLRGEDPVEVSVNIDLFSKVLTLVVTDFLPAEGVDQVLLIDPRIELAY